VGLLRRRQEMLLHREHRTLDPEEVGE
jgi:hypothetical protein